MIRVLHHKIHFICSKCFNFANMIPFMAGLHYVCSLTNTVHTRWWDGKITFWGLSCHAISTVNITLHILTKKMNQIVFIYIFYYFGNIVINKLQYKYQQSMFNRLFIWFYKINRKTHELQLQPIRGFSGGFTNNKVDPVMFPPSLWSLTCISNFHFTFNIRIASFMQNKTIETLNEMQSNPIILH